MKPGDTVICITNNKRNPYNVPMPTVGQTYTVICVDQNHWLTLEEMGLDYGYNKNCFVPIDHWSQAETMVNELTETINQPVEI